MNSRFALATALRESFAQGYNFKKFTADALAGITVGLIALPLAMALAIASDVPPQNGLYTAIIGGFIIALFGGSRFNVSGPTAAFAVLLLPIVHQFGLGGLMLTTLLAGIFLIALAISGLGNLIRYLPYPVMLGFTSGIGLVIASLQLQDFLGIEVTEKAEHFFDRAVIIFAHLQHIQWQETLIGAFTLLILILWPRFNKSIPRHLPALIIGTSVAWLATVFIDGFSVDTIGSRFSSVLENGEVVQGISASLPQFIWPWQQPNINGQPIGFSMELLRQLLAPALGLAVLGAIESLLCASVADQISGTKHNPNAELLGQGIGNIVLPFFGGITATAAIARTSANLRSGAVSPIAAMIHAMVILLSMVLLAPWLNLVPMSVMAALLLMVAWNISEAKHFGQILRKAPAGDIFLLLTCFFLTVVFDMVLAVAVGLILASFLFMKNMTDLTQTKNLANSDLLHDLPPWLAILQIEGALFFGVAERINQEILKKTTSTHLEVIILDISTRPLAKPSNAIPAKVPAIYAAHNQVKASSFAAKI
jgi:SulP family sulfate permease